MCLSMFYITVEWCQQSFLSTENYDAAMKGLRRTRKYRSWTFFARQVSRALSFGTVHQLEKLAILCGLVKKPQKTLLWSKRCKKGVGRGERTARAHEESGQYATPPAELVQYHNSNDAVLLRVQEPPAVVERTLSPPASGTSHRRNESDASFNPMDPLSLPPRPSDDSLTPLIRVPSQARRQNDGEIRSSSEGRGGSETGLLEPNST